MTTIKTIREEFGKAYDTMPENFERVSRVSITDWWLDKMTQLIEGDIEWAESCADFDELMTRAKSSIGGKLTDRDVWALSFGVNYFRDNLITHLQKQLAELTK